MEILRTKKLGNNLVCKVELRNMSTFEIIINLPVIWNPCRVKRSENGGIWK